MKEIKKQEYETPQIELINARVEKGFQGSVTSYTNTGGPIGEGDSYDESIFS